jgi:hypothetical protein
MTKKDTRKWFDKTNMIDAASVMGDEELLSKIQNHDGVLKFIDVGIEPLTVEVNEMETFEVPFTISTASVDRDGDVIKQDGWELSEYMKNPVVLWAHDTSEPPVAKSAMVYVDGETDSLKSIAKFPSKDLYPFGNMIGRMYLNGFLRGASVGFLPTEYEIDETRDGMLPTNFKKQKLLEWSAVPVPSNPEGLAQARSFGIDTSPILGWAEKILDGEGSVLLPRVIVERAYAETSPIKIFISKGTSGGLEIDDISDEEEEPEVTSDVAEETPAPEVADPNLPTILPPTEDGDESEEDSDQSSEEETLSDDDNEKEAAPITGEESLTTSTEKTVDDGFEVPNLESLRAMVRESVGAEMNELRTLIGRLTEVEKQ